LKMFSPLFMAWGFSTSKIGYVKASGRDGD
jgi:hypothetical protein